MWTYLLKSCLSAIFDSLVCFPSKSEKLNEINEIEYDEITGWQEPLPDYRKYADMPKTFKDYVAYIENAVGVPVKLVSIGPDRDETIMR